MAERRVAHELLTCQVFGQWTTTGNLFQIFCHDVLNVHCQRLDMSTLESLLCLLQLSNLDTRTDGWCGRKVGTVTVVQGGCKGANTDHFSRRICFDLFWKIVNEEETTIMTGDCSTTAASALRVISRRGRRSQATHRDTHFLAIQRRSWTTVMPSYDLH